MLRTVAPLGACALACVSAHTAISHEARSGWSYPMECCHDQDCAEYPEENVQVLSGGFLLKPTNEFIPQEKARISPDGRYHLCRFEPTNTILCFFYPPPST